MITRKVILLALILWGFNQAIAQEDSTIINDDLLVEAYKQYVDSIEQTFIWERGSVTLSNGVATINVPKGYKFLGPEQSNIVLTELWGNPPSDVLGMLFPEETSPTSDNFTYGVEITYSDEGFIEDDEAKDLDYDDMLEEMQSDVEQANPARKEQGYPTYELLGWASQPFYDSETKKLHWAQEIKFEGEEKNTLNYNIRVLGRKGYLNLNVIGTMDVLSMVKEDVNPILASVDFNEGHKYSDFNPDIDKVAAYGIGGLIAGKMLAKVGFFALILKFWKVIALALGGAFVAFKNKFFSKKEKKEHPGVS